MATTIDARRDARVDLEAAQQWVRDHGYAPEDLRSTVTVNDDGTVTLERMLRHRNGDLKIAPSGDEIATEPVTVAPTRPFPLEA